MKTAFTPHFQLAQPGLRLLTTRPFVPSYPTPFIDGKNCLYYRGEGCSLSYKWHDGYSEYFGLLEVRTQVALRIPYESFVKDLHLLYQLHGHATIGKHANPRNKGNIVLPENHKLEAYSPPATGWLHLAPSEKPQVLVALALRRTWATRYPAAGPNPLEEAIQLLRDQFNRPYCLPPSTIPSTMHAELHLLLHMPFYPDTSMDGALNGPVGRLFSQHKAEHLTREQQKKEQQLLESARHLVAHMIRDMREGQKRPTVAVIAQALHTSEKHLWELHRQAHGTGMHLYIHDQCLEEAKRLLVEEHLSIATVSARLDFSALSNFSRQFKHKYGVTPREFIRQLPKDPGTHP